MFICKAGDVILYKCCMFYLCVKVNVLNVIVSDGKVNYTWSKSKLFKSNTCINLGEISDDVLELNNKVFDTFDKKHNIYMADVLGNELSIGDLVIYYSNVNLPMPLYAIVYSLTELFTEYGIIGVQNTEIISDKLLGYSFKISNFVYKINKEIYRMEYTRLVSINNRNMKYLLTQKLDNNTLFIDYIDAYSRNYHLTRYNKLDGLHLYLYKNENFYISENNQYYNKHKLNINYKWKLTEEKESNLTESFFIVGKYNKGGNKNGKE